MRKKTDIIITIIRSTNLQDIRKDVILHGRVMDSHGATPYFGAVQYEVVVLAADLTFPNVTMMCMSMSMSTSS